MALIYRLTMQDADGTKFVVYCEHESEVEMIEESTGASCVSRRTSNKTEMQMEQFLTLNGTTTRELAENDPLGPS